MAGSRGRWRIFPKGYAGGLSLRTRRKAMVMLLGAFLVVLLSPGLRNRVYSLLSYPVHYREYKHFGIRVPGNFSVHGIDVSRYQGRIDWKRVASMKVNDIQIDFAFIKATEGSWMRDPQFPSNWRNAGRTRIIRGAYHYFLPNISPKDQARIFTKTVKLKPGDLPPVVDVEETRGMTPEQVRRYTLLFCQLLEKKYGVKPIIYTGRDYYKNHFADQKEFNPYPFWIAHYHVPELEMPDKRIFTFWQHNNTGTVNGINENVDFNVFNGNREALERLLIK